MTPEDILSLDLDVGSVGITVDQCAESHLTIDSDFGDVHMEYISTYKDVVENRMIDMVLPGQRRVTFFAGRSTSTFDGMGVRSGSTRGDLYVHVVISMPREFPNGIPVELHSINPHNAIKLRQ